MSGGSPPGADTAVPSGTNVGIEFARFLADLRARDVPSEVLEHAKLCILDTLGCALLGATLESTRIVRDCLAAVDSSLGARAWGSRVRISAPHAAMINGTAVHGFELDDLHPGSIVHPGSVTLPAVFAAAALVPVTGEHALLAVVAGYETAARVGLTMGAAHLLAGWHPTGTHGALGAAAAAGTVLRLSVRQFQDALGCAGSFSAGLMAAQYESMVKRLHAGRAAQSGLYAALLAQRGFVGIADIFEAAYGGYGNTFSDHFDVTALTRELGDAWEVMAVGFKPYACNGSCHPAVDLLREMYSLQGLAAADVESVDVFVSTATMKHVGWRYKPDTVTTAQMNLSYIAAVVLTDGDAFIDQFSESRTRDPGLVELAGRVTVHADRQIDALGNAGRHATRIEVHLLDGRTLHGRADFARGSSKKPLSRAEVEAKYLRLAQMSISQTALQELADRVWSLEREPSLERLEELLCSM